MSAAGTVTRTESDGLGRPTGVWVGTDDVPMSGFWSVSNLAGTDMVKVRAYEYDGGGVGDSTLTKVTEFPGLSATPRVTSNWYDWRDRPIATKRGVEMSESADVNRPLTYAQYDNLGEVVSSELYDGDAVTLTASAGVPQRPAANLLRAESGADYDELGRAYRTRRHSVDQSTGAVAANALVGDTWFDLRGLVAKTATPGGLVQKVNYDGAGRAVTTYVSDGGGDVGWADALTVTGDTMLSQSESGFDADGNAILMTGRERLPGAAGTGALGTPSAGVPARVSYAAAYYDLANRMTDSVSVGTNGGVAWTRPAAVPSRSDVALVSSTLYDAAGRAWVTTDPRGIASRTEYDLLGRVTRTVENYVDGVPSDADDKTTEYGYGPAGMTSLTAHLAGGGSQTTEWVYGVTTAGGSGLNSNDVVGETRWPDPLSGAASAGERDNVRVNALGQAVGTTDRNGTAHALSYDALGRFGEDAVTLLGVDVDGAVRRVGVGYDTLGNASLVSSYSAASGGSVVNQVKRSYDGLGQLLSEAQSHAGAVTAATPTVQYGHDFQPGAGSANRSRLTSMTYPDGRVVGTGYGVAGGLDDRISRLSALTDSGVTLEGYTYLGLGTVVARSHPQSGVDLTYVKRPGEPGGDAGDSVSGLDRFGRVGDQRWVGASGADLDRHTYGYDRGGNRSYRDDKVNAAFGEVYSYDGLSQVTGFRRGTLDAAKTGLVGPASRSQGYGFDALGNFTSVTTDGVSQSRAANKQNEVTAVAGAVTPEFDAAGNMTGDEAGRKFVYDAWNRLVAVKSGGGVLLKSYAYDGTGRRVSDTPAGGAATELYYSSGWQVLEERVGGVARASYVWSPVYVDALVARDRDADGAAANGREERLYALADANYNVTALVGVDGVVKERYAYDAFGSVTVMGADYATRGASGYGWAVLFQGMTWDAATGLYGSTRSRGSGYSPTLGQFISPDPILFWSSDANLGRFVGNNAVGRTDPSGLADFTLPSLPTIPRPTLPRLPRLPGWVGGGAVVGVGFPVAALTAGVGLVVVAKNVGGSADAIAESITGISQAAMSAPNPGYATGLKTQTQTQGPQIPKPPKDDDCDKPCKPCTPPVGSIAYRVDLPPSPAHNGIPTPHSHKYVMMQSPPRAGCKCFWKEVLRDPLPGILGPPITPAAGGGILP